MKNNQFEILTNLIHDIANQFAIKKIDEDVLFHSIIAYDNLGVTNLFGVLGIELKELIILSNKILSEKEKGQPSYRFNKKIAIQPYQTSASIICNILSSIGHMAASMNGFKNSFKIN